MIKLNYTSTAELPSAAALDWANPSITQRNLSPEFGSAREYPLLISSVTALSLTERPSSKTAP